MPEIKDYILGFLGGTLGCSSPDEQKPQVNAATAPAQSAAPAEVKEEPKCTKTVKDCPSKESCDSYVTYPAEQDDLKAMVEEGKPSECAYPQNIESLIGCSDHFINYSNRYREIAGEMSMRLTAVSLLLANPECIDTALATDANACCYRDQVGTIRSVQHAATQLEGENAVNAEQPATFAIELEKVAGGMKEKIEAYDQAKKGAAALKNNVDKLTKQVKGAERRFRDYGELDDDKAVLEAKQKELDEAKKNLDIYQKSGLGVAKKGLLDAISQYKSSKKAFMVAAKTGWVVVNRNDAKLVEWDGILLQAQKALGVTSAPGRGIEEWGGEKPKPNQTDEW